MKLGKRQTCKLQRLIPSRKFNLAVSTGRTPV